MVRHQRRSAQTSARGLCDTRVPSVQRARSTSCLGEHGCPNERNKFDYHAEEETLPLRFEDLVDNGLEKLFFTSLEGCRTAQVVPVPWFSFLFFVGLSVKLRRGREYANHWLFGRHLLPFNASLLLTGVSPGLGPGGVQQFAAC